MSSNLTLSATSAYDRRFFFAFSLLDPFSLYAEFPQGNVVNPCGGIGRRLCRLINAKVEKGNTELPSCI